MSDRFYRIPIKKLFRWITNEEELGRIFGLYKKNLFIPKSNDTFRMTRYCQLLETPIGVAAGPQTQLAHNIIASWLCGARYIELKTVQTLDEIEVTKPCIDMEDEGYNCEWSQELKVQDSFDEYLNAWILIHILKHKFGWNTEEPGFIFNMSVGYDLKGILNHNVQWFLDKMNNCKDELEEKIEILIPFYPDIKDLNIPYHISDNITLSTMHGCPPDEIEKIGKYFIEERKLQTAIKLNPTLLGPEKVRYILNEKLGYEITVPDEAFEHDLKYDDAVKMIKSLTKIAKENNVQFGLKLTNTLESLNSTHWLPKKEKMVYTSGRALHPLSINLASKLQSDFNGTLDLTFSAGVDAFNVTDTLACGLTPITVCSDLLKPGGYLRLTQYLENLEKNISESGSKNIEEFIRSKDQNNSSLSSASLSNLKKYSESILKNKTYHKSNFPYENIKTQRELTEYDCIKAPCIKTCAVEQNVPEYMYHTAKGDYENAFKVILKDNPLPNITGNVCDHLCQTKCTRINYDNPLLIRGIKRFISEKYEGKINLIKKDKNGLKAAIIGAGPSGLTCAYFLAIEGFEVNIYESNSFSGGMVSGFIPVFRLSDKQIEDDIKIIEQLGVKINYDQKITKESFSELKQKNDFIFVGIGASLSKKLQIPGEELENVFDQLSFLSKTRIGNKIKAGKNIAIIGAGLSAVDAARTANRIKEKDGKVTMIYRRTKNEMPVGDDEIKAVLEEGIDLIELAAPLSISQKDEKLNIKLIKMKLGDKDESGRRRPIQIENSEFNLNFDSIITAIGQDISYDFIDEKSIKINHKTFETQIPNVFAGGDVLRGADSLINAMGDGKKAAEEIINRSNKILKTETAEQKKKLSFDEFQKIQAHRKFGDDLPEISLEERTGFKMVHPVLDEETAKQEAERCLFCEDVCNICVGVCPNFSNVSFEVEKTELPVWQIIKKGNDFSFNQVDSFVVKQENQILNIGDFCNECGNCDTFCPTSGAPYKTKPHFYLTEGSFNSERLGYFITNNSIKFKNNGNLESLSLSNDFLFYESNDVIVKFNKNDFSIMEINFKTDAKELNLKHAAEMFFLLKSLKNNPIFT
ncbi:MAG: putative selenate reductase subunit YgfK [Ignavibacteriales bacterium CG12_big_fil_rev_8_21_14_0_65_30_8]|nr:MAG: putative selenate reductase subunit YgfK [Ignavibacteriales bacterium CG12_big_fil_rev_8_21_14_0_65_30_8]